MPLAIPDYVFDTHVLPSSPVPEVSTGIRFVRANLQPGVNSLEALDAGLQEMLGASHPGRRTALPDSWLRGHGLGNAIGNVYLPPSGVIEADRRGLAKLPGILKPLYDTAGGLIVNGMIVHPWRVAIGDIPAFTRGEVEAGLGLSSFDEALREGLFAYWAAAAETMQEKMSPDLRVAVRHSPGIPKRFIYSGYESIVGDTKPMTFILPSAIGKARGPVGSLFLTGCPEPLATDYAGVETLKSIGTKRAENLGGKPITYSGFAAVSAFLATQVVEIL